MTYHASYEDYHRLLAKLSHRAARRAAAFGLSIDFDDAMQEARIAYLRACEGFDPQLGVKFSTYLWRAVQNNLRRLEAKARDATRGQVSLDAQLGEDLGTLHDLVSDESLEPIEERIERLERESANFARLTPEAKRVIVVLNEPPLSLVQEVRRLNAFRLKCKASGYAAPNVKLDVALVCRALGYSDRTRRAVEQEFKQIMETAVG